VKDDTFWALVIVLFSLPVLTVLNAWVVTIILGWVGIGATMWQAWAFSSVVAAITTNPIKQNKERKDGTTATAHAVEVVLTYIVAGLSSLAVTFCILAACGWPTVSDLTVLP